MNAAWPRNPRIYEINTWVWLTTLSNKYEYAINLHNLPEEELDELSSYHVDAIWLMGVWFRGPSSRGSALNYIHEYVGALPDITEADIGGSAYAIGNYEVEEALGGRDGLAAFRERLRQRGMRLILDFVPNHTGHDHPWLLERPDYYVHGTWELLSEAPGEFFTVKTASGEEKVIAYGRDPYFPGWIDTVQLNAFDQGYRQAAVRTLSEIASMADGVRCDMAMLMTTEVFMRSWGWRGLQPPEVDFWDYVIPRVKDQFSNFIFISEVYWNMNHALLTQGFDYTYDKTMYDRLLSGNVGGIYAHLGADKKYLEQQIRFIENHDEPRAADTLGLERTRPAAVLISTLPGATLLHDGQFTGRIIKLPVQITRQPNEREHPALKEFYLRLLQEADDDIYRDGQWELFPCYPACDGCDGSHNIMAYGWRMEDELRLIVLNLSGEWSQAFVEMTVWSDVLPRFEWKLLDVLHRTYTEENGEDIANGLHVDMEPHQAMIYQFLPVKKRRRKRKKAASRA